MAKKKLTLRERIERLENLILSQDEWLEDRNLDIYYDLGFIFHVLRKVSKHMLVSDKTFFDIVNSTLVDKELEHFQETLETKIKGKKE